MLPHFIRLIEKYYADPQYFFWGYGTGPEAIQERVDFFVKLYNNVALFTITNIDESSLLFNGYLREIIKDVTGYDIGMKYHEYYYDGNCCGNWHLRYSNKIN